MFLRRSAAIASWFTFFTEESGTVGRPASCSNASIATPSGSRLAGRGWMLAAPAPTTPSPGSHFSTSVSALLEILSWESAIGRYPWFSVPHLGQNFSPLSSGSLPQVRQVNLWFFFIVEGLAPARDLPHSGQKLCFLSTLAPQPAQRTLAFFSTSAVSLFGAIGSLRLHSVQRRSLESAS